MLRKIDREDRTFQAAYAIISMFFDIAMWYNEEGSFSLEIGADRLKPDVDVFLNAIAERVAEKLEQVNK